MGLIKQWIRTMIDDSQANMAKKQKDVPCFPFYRGKDPSGGTTNWNYCLYIIDVKNEKFYYEEVPIWKPTEDGCWYKIWSCLKGCFRRMTCCNKEEDESNNDDLYSLHRIYIRLQKRLDKDDAVSHYYLSFGGVNIESVRISREDTSILKLREMGKDIANKLNLNYFDYEDKSAHHVIRHRGKNTSK